MTMEKSVGKSSKAKRPETIFSIAWRDVEVIKKKFPNEELTEKEWEDLLSKHGIPFSKRKK